MPPPPSDAIVAQTALYTMWREPHVLTMKLRGDVGERESITWRGAVDAHTAKAGWPPYMVADLTEALSVGPLASRIRTGQWTKSILKQIREGAIYTGRNEASLFVTRSLLRLVGMPNVRVVDSAASLDALYEIYRRG